MQARAAVMRAKKAPLSLENIEVDDPGPGEVRLQMVAAGICGSDRHVLDGRFPSPVPAVAGHEGAGIVEAVGPGVAGISVGDHVIQTFVPHCGVCDQCRRGHSTFCVARARADGALLDGTFRMRDEHGFSIATTLALGTFSSVTVTPAHSCVVIPSDIDLGCAALVSCGVSTGMGSVINMARTRPGDRVAVLGVGGVGAAAILGAVIAGASDIIAVDALESKRHAALGLGATAFIGQTDPQAVGGEIAELTSGRGVDAFILSVNHIVAAHYGLAVAALAPGGIVVQVGTSEAALDHIPVSPGVFTSKQASFVATVYGGMDPVGDSLRYLDLFRAGRLPLQKLITRTYELDDINDAFGDLDRGLNVRGVIRF